MNVPNGWQVKPLSALAQYINGYAFKPDDWGKDGLPIIRIEQLKDPNTITDYFSGHLPDANLIEDGDLVFSWSASLFLRIWNHGRAALNQHLFKVVEAESVNRLFLKLLIEHSLPELTKASHGSTMQHITRKELDRFTTSLPSDTHEQSKIAEVLSTVDRAIAQTEALIAKQQRIKTGLMQDLLTRGIDEHGQLRSEATHAFKDSPLGRIPVEWDVKQLDSVAEFVTSGARGWAKYYSEEGAIFLRIGNLTREHINLRLDDIVHVQPPTSAEGTRTQVQHGDLLISVTADLGIIGVIPSNIGIGYVNQHIALARLDSERVSSRFVGWFLGGQQGRNQFDKLNESGAKAGLNLPTVRSLLFPSPSLAEQTRIAVMLDSNVEALTRGIDTLRKLRHLKTALMQDLLTGKVRVTPLLACQKEVVDA